LWVWAVFGAAAVAVWLIIVGALRLITRFEYTKKSALAVMGCALASLLAGFYFGFASTDAPSLLAWILAPVYSFVFFVALANAVCELWMRKHLAVFDKEIEGLLEKEYKERNRLEEARDRVHNESLRRRQNLERHREMLERREQLMASVERWQQSGGGARVRSIKVEEWREKFRSLQETELAKEREALKQQIAGMTPMKDEASLERHGALRTELSILDIEVINRRAPDEPDATPINDVMVKQEEVKKMVDDIERKLLTWRRKREEFLQGRVRLE